MIVAVIQARMGSSRLPGKVLKNVGSMPMIGYMLSRISRCELIDKIIVATSESSENDDLADYVSMQGFEVFRGSEHDVLERVTLAVRPYNPTSVLRLTADCVLIDREIVANLIRFFRNSGLDYAWLGESFAEGLDAEIMAYSALEIANSEASFASEREHVTQYFHRNPERFKLKSLDNDTDDSSYRIVVDNQEDYQLICKIVEHFELVGADTDYSFFQIKKFLDDNNFLKTINGHIIRNEGLIKSLLTDKKVR